MKKFFRRILEFFKRKKKPVSSTFIPHGGIIINDRPDYNVPDKVLGDTSSEESKKKVQTYTKKFVTAITVAAIMWISASYVFAGYALFAYAETQPLSDLSQQVCITLLGMSLGYFLKAWGETFAEKKNELDNKRLDYSIDANNVQSNTMNQYTHAG